MRKWLFVPIVVAILGVILVNGCAPSVAPEDFAKLQGELTASQNRVTKLETQVQKLSTISAYSIWYDQYYAVNNYVFKDTKTFNEQFGVLVAATGDAASQAAFSAYLAAATALDNLVASLPKDYTTWTADQTNQWTKASAARYDAFGKVGTALYNTTNFSASQVRILELKAQVAGLSAISAYIIWYDQYYLIGNYAFADVATFNAKLGSLVYATNHAGSITAWYSYLAADTALTDLVASLPKDYTTWTADQTNQWTKASAARYTALGAVGTALFTAIVSYY